MIPVNEKIGYPTVSASQLRTYGASGFSLDEQEQEKGCPRQWKAKYVERRVKDERKSYPLAYGSYIHDIFHTMERDDVTPDEAIERCFPVDGDPEMIREAKKDLAAYMARGASPSDRFMTLAVELDLHAELYVDPEFGPIYWRGIIDWIGLDPEDPGIVHVIDYKTNRFPPSIEAVRGDVQLKSYAWLVKQVASTLGLPSNVRVVVHLDAIKWRDVTVTFTDADIEDWHSWAVAVVRTMCRDEECAPVLNPGCAWCPVQDDCPAMLALPQIGKGMSEDEPKPDQGWDDRLRWRDEANRVRLHLEKRVKAIDEAVKEEVEKDGEVIGNGTRYVLVPQWQTVIDVKGLHRVLGDEFYACVNVVKGRVERLTESMDASEVPQVEAKFQRVPQGTKVSKEDWDGPTAG